MMRTIDRVLLLRKVRVELGNLRDGIITQFLDLNDRLATARDIVLAVRAEVIAARGGHPSIDDRLDAIEAQLPPTP